MHLATTGTYESILRTFELNLMDSIGYGMNFTYDSYHDKPIISDNYYSYNKESGLVENSKGQFSGMALLAMAQRNFDQTQVLSEAKQLMRQVIDSHLQGKQLKSRSVINSIIKRL
jgi:DNA repair protein RecO (recombination protein O)